MMPLWTSASALGGVRMGVDLGRRAVGRPAGVADADAAGERRAAELVLEVAELALGAAAREVAVLQRRDAGRIVAAVFQPLQRIDQQRRHRRRARECRRCRTCAANRRSNRSSTAILSPRPTACRKSHPVIAATTIARGVDAKG